MVFKYVIRLLSLAAVVQEKGNMLGHGLFYGSEG